MIVTLPQTIYYRGAPVAVAMSRRGDTIVVYEYGGSQFGGETELITRMNGHTTTRRRLRLMLDELAFRGPAGRLFKWVGVISEGTWTGAAYELGPLATVEIPQPGGECSICMGDMRGPAVECKHLTASMPDSQKVAPPCPPDHAAKSASGPPPTGTPTASAPATRTPCSAPTRAATAGTSCPIWRRPRTTAASWSASVLERSGVAWCPAHLPGALRQQSATRPGDRRGALRALRGHWCYLSRVALAYTSSGSGVPICGCGVEEPCSRSRGS